MEQGTHIDLLSRQNSTYKRMWEAQNGRLAADDGCLVDLQYARDQLLDIKYSSFQPSDDQDTSSYALSPSRQQSSIGMQTSSLDRGGLRPPGFEDNQLSQFEANLRNSGRISRSLSSDLNGNLENDSGMSGTSELTEHGKDDEEVPTPPDAVR